MFKIALSDCGKKNKNYEKFVSRIPGSSTVILSAGRANDGELKSCDGLVLTGGKDVAPELFGDWADETVEVDSERDGFEFKLIEKSIKLGLPILGICRGIQVVNVYLGGTLILDLQKYHARKHDEVKEDVDRTHPIKVVPSSRLGKFVGRESGTVNSAHHQAVERIGKGLKLAARAEDGTVEALEGDEELTSKIVLVQWHPERMDFENPFAHGVLDLFARQMEDNQHSEKYAQWRSNNE